MTLLAGKQVVTKQQQQDIHNAIFVQRHRPLSDFITQTKADGILMVKWDRMNMKGQTGKNFL